MPRDGAAARARLRAAALELYREQGYDATTTAEIAERAGVTERTYFRHFADKREVLFDGEDELKAVLRAAVGDAPAEAPPLEVLHGAFVASVPLFVAGRSAAEQRAPIIAGTPALLERANAKRAAVVDGLADALADRGLPVPTAVLAAQVGMAAFGRAASEWDGAAGSTLERLLDTAFAELRALG
jgi:AcrR family transcriptional regulator